MFFFAKTTMTAKAPTVEERALHRDYLASNGAVLLAAGPTFHQESEIAEGSIFLFEADSWRTAEAFVKEDPFYQLGFRASVEIFAWRPGGYARKFPVDPSEI